MLRSSGLRVPYGDPSYSSQTMSYHELDDLQKAIGALLGIITNKYMDINMPGI